MGLILFTVASTRDVPIYKSQQHSSRFYRSLPLFSFVLISFTPLLHSWWFLVCVLWLWCETWVSAELAGISYVNLLGMFPTVFEELEIKQSIEDAMIKWHTHFKLIDGTCVLTVEHSKFSVMAGLIVSQSVSRRFDFTENFKTL